MGAQFNPEVGSCLTRGVDLASLADGEAGPRTAALAAHVVHCPLCCSRLSEMAAAQASVAQARQRRAASLNTLAAMRAVRGLPTAADQVSGLRRMISRALWVWTFQRPWCWAALLALAASGARALVGT